MANTLAAIMPKILARSLGVLRKRAIMPQLVNGDYSSVAANKGDTIDVPIPTAVGTQDVVPSNTPPAPSNRTPEKVQVQLNHWRQSDPFHLSDKDMVEIDRNAHFLPMTAEAAVVGLAEYVNGVIMDEYKRFYGAVGTAATTPFATTVAAATQARKLLNQQKCPKTGRRGVLDFDAEANALALSQFSDFDKVGSATEKREGEIGRKYGIDWFADDDVRTHTSGTITTGLIAKASTAVAAGVKTFVATTAASTGACALVVGDIININGQTQQYVLTSAATQASAASDVTLEFEPALQVALVGSEAITVVASHVANLVFHRDAIAFAMRPLVSETIDFKGGSEIMSLQDPLTGLVLRLEVSRQHKQTVWEYDILFGTRTVRPELGVRILG